MITHFKNLLKVAGIALLIVGCTRQGENKLANDEIADSTAVNLTSSAAKENLRDSAHVFIRTADLRFKVSDVVNAVYSIEDIVNNHGGFVTLSQLNSDVYARETTQVSADSSVEISRYTVVGNVTIRVPNTKLDTTLKEIAKLVQFVDNRTIKATDISLQLKSNRLLENRYANHEKRLTSAIDEKGKRLTDITKAEDQLLNKQEQVDNTSIETASLKDQVAYSTITLQIYQDNLQKAERHANAPVTEPYVPSFSERVGVAFNEGWRVIKELVIACISIWPLLLLGFAGYLGYRKFSQKKGVPSRLV